MNATQLLAHFDRLAEAPNAVPRLRRFILDLAVRGKLVEQDAGDEPAAELLERIKEAKFRLSNEGLAKKEKPLQLSSKSDHFLFQTLGVGRAYKTSLGIFNGESLRITQSQMVSLLFRKNVSSGGDWT
jgi:hypothetical protein